MVNKVYRNTKKTTEEFKNEVYNLVGDEYEVVGEYITALIKIEMKHNKCGKTYFIMPNEFLKGMKCWHCSKTRKLSHEEVVERIYNLVGDEYCLLDEYAGNKTKIRFQHCSKECNHIFEMSPHNFITSGQRCPTHQNNKLYSQQEYENLVFKKNPNLKILGKYKGKNEIIKVKCLLDDYVWTPHAGILLKTVTVKGCPKCKALDITGSKCLWWNGGKTQIKKYLREHIRPWVIASIISDNDKCVITGNKKNKVVHHCNKQFYEIFNEVFLKTGIPLRETISDYSEIELKTLSDLCLKLHWDYGLGLTLDKEVHNLFHTRFGATGNTKDQIIEFAKSYNVDLTKRLA